MFAAVFQMLVHKLFSLDYNSAIRWFPISRHVSFAFIIMLIAWFVFKSKLKDFYKAVYAMVPTAVILVTTGILLYQWPMVLYVIGTIFYGTIIIYLYKTKKSWIFYYAVTLVSAALLILGVLGIDI
jgi:hypothetical protein